ncbi:MAG: hypothetical protein U5K30_13790 [Acidimicrobiales bacterium]|nr:hypothetical protein [Acidimicrobiales bacterium]
MVDELQPVSAAVDRGEWTRALELLDALGDSARDPQGLELRASASYGAGQFEACVSAWEEHHSLSLATGDDIDAARAAAMIAMYLMIDTGLMAPVRGWLRTAERLASGDDDAPAHAMIAMVRTYERFMCGDMERSRAEAERAIELGERLGVQPAVVIGRVATARITILDGNLDEGLDQLDEVGALLMSGQVDPLTTGMMLCELICAAQGLAMHDRAAEWTEVMERWRHGAAFGGIHGRCRVHRAEMLRMSGPTDAAEAEALGACDDLRPWMRREFGWPLAELGNIRLRRGDLDGAEEAFTAAYEHAWCPHPGLAQVRLARGDVDGAAALIDEAIQHPIRIPSKERPPFGDLYLAPLLETQVEIAVAAGDLDTAREASERLDSIATTYARSPYLVASAALARARTALLSDETDAAISGGNDAVAGWSESGAPYEAAVARMVLAEAHERAGNQEAAQMQRSAAASAFESFGAAPAAANAAALADTRPARPARERQSRDGVFRVEDGMRRIVFDGNDLSIRDLKGFRYLERMLADPDREFHVLDLVSVDGGTLPTRPTVDPTDEMTSVRGDADLPTIDDEAREAYRRRLREVEEDLEDAKAANDLGRMELAERDRDFLVAELSHAVGLGGRLRSTGGDAEKARGSVSRCLRYALGQLTHDLPSLADHLRASLQTGTYCAYRPDPMAAVTWQT